MDAYVEYVERIKRVVADVNLKHGTSDWQPIDLRLEDDMDQAVAAYKLFDVLVVNAIFDGMNLVIKEAVLVNENDGVLALSENTRAPTRSWAGSQSPCTRSTSSSRPRSSNALSRWSGASGVSAWQPARPSSARTTSASGSERNCVT